MNVVRPVVLIVMDGWGVSTRKKGNAIAAAKTPRFNSLWKKYPHTFLCASGECVGLPKGSQGSSEVGHLNMGAGRIVRQSLGRINKAIEDKSFSKNKAFNDAFENCRKHKSALHLMGLVQDQGVHAHQDHLFALIRLAAACGVSSVWVHFFSDGRDTPPKSSLKFLNRLEAEMKKSRSGEIGTVMGRYYSMDRDNRWERTEKAYEALVNACGQRTATAREAIAAAYARGETDEFISPTIVGGFEGIAKNDSVIFFNYRLDRTRQLTKAFVEPKFGGFQRRRAGVFFVCMTEYYAGVPARVAFPPENMKNLFGQVVAARGLRQLRVSETEKYAHVTFFFNGQIEKPNKGEDRVMVPSPKVPTYDLEPGMSAPQVTTKLVEAVKSDRYDVVICNIVNCDMVGHTGVWKAVLKAVETVDDSIGKITEAVKSAGGAAIITADHGNAEKKVDARGNVLTAHTTNKVPFILVCDRPELKRARLRRGVLADVSPTMLQLLGIPKPKEMTARSLVVG
ncbi:MAG: 2,3-bisphosphoglycerate-independent phosphoglycerate mutase [Candidatus Micrarchaeota archaeon]|nr:2,3-bisphosphoglycerate-independent phosphoglycerate mutase [Candidatus Micrarchaeota archaeon]